MVDLVWFRHILKFLIRITLSPGSPLEKTNNGRQGLMKRQLPFSGDTTSVLSLWNQKLATRTKKGSLNTNFKNFATFRLDAVVFGAKVKLQTKFSSAFLP